MANVPITPSQLINPMTGGTVGVQAKAPPYNIPAPTTTLPKTQIAPKDLSGTYANVGGTIYNTQSQTKFSNPADFFKDSGVNSFDNLKFNTNYTPTGKETIYGQPSPTPQSTPPPNTTPQPSPTPNSTSNTTPTNSGPYTPPNGGTTGVSQGGVVGDLISNAENNPALAVANKNLQDLRNSEAQSEANIDSEPIDLSLASGQKGILQRLFAAKEGAAQSAVSNALAGQSNTTSGLSSAGSLNAPITNLQTGGLVNPSSPTTTGQTTSGAQNISSLIGTRTDANGKPNGEYYNTQTGQGFKTPQELSDFINQQLGNPNATTAQNVFDLLKSGSLNSSGGSNNALNPIANVSSIAQQVISGQISPSQAYAMGGTVANWQTLLNNELQKENPGFDTSAAQAKYDSNQQTHTNQLNQIATWKSASQQATNLGSQLNDLLGKYNLNPNSVNIGNQLLQLVAQNTSDPRYITLQNLVTDLANTYANVLTPPGGSVTDMVRSISSGLLGSDNSGKTISQVIQTLDQQVQAKIAGVSTGSTTNNNSSSSGGNWGWNGQ